MRIVSLLPSATEILFAIGAGDDVAGVTHECDYPDAARSLPQLTSSALPPHADPAAIDRHVREYLHAGSSLYHLDAAKLEELAPDLIVTQELCEVCAVSYDVVDRAARRLRSDPRILSLEPSSLDDVFATIELLGRSTGREPAAYVVVAELRARVAALRARTHSPSRPSVALLEWTDPPMSAGHWIPELLEAAGAHPVLAHPGANSQRLQWEDVAREDPDAIVVAPCGFDRERSVAAVSALEDVAAWRGLRAVRSGRVFPMDGNAYFSRPGPRLVEAAELVARVLA